MTDGQELFCIISIPALIIVLLSCFLIAGANRCDFRTARVEIEQLRKDAAKIDLSSSEDVMGKVADFNMKIKSNQYWNGVVWADIFIPDGWDDIREIEIKK